jgi:hypothetical protein
MARQHIAFGLDRLAVSNGGKTVRVLQMGTSVRSGHLDQELDALLGITQALGVRSVVVVSLDVNGVRRGTIHIDGAQPEHDTAADRMLGRPVRGRNRLVARGKRYIL